MIDPPLSLAVRLISALAALVGLSVLAVAWALEPDPRGYGTHEKLGLPPCVFLESKGRPCPTCGLTTAMAATAKGRFRVAFRANPGGLVLMPATVALVFISGFAATTRRARFRGRRVSFRDVCVVFIGIVVLITVVGPALRR